MCNNCGNEYGICEKCGHKVEKLVFPYLNGEMWSHIWARNMRSHNTFCKCDDLYLNSGRRD